MNSVKVRREELLGVLRTNRNTHRAQFEAALEGWKKRVQAELATAYNDAVHGRKYRTTFSLPQPQDHSDDYDRAIAMLEMEVSDVVEIDARTFTQLALDDWNWKRDFLASYAVYLTEEV